MAGRAKDVRDARGEAFRRGLRGSLPFRGSLRARGVHDKVDDVEPAYADLGGVAEQRAEVGVERVICKIHADERLFAELVAAARCGLVLPDLEGELERVLGGRLAFAVAEQHAEQLGQIGVDVKRDIEVRAVGIAERARDVEPEVVAAHARDIQQSDDEVEHAAEVDHLALGAVEADIDRGADAHAAVLHYVPVLLVALGCGVGGSALPDLQTEVAELYGELEVAELHIVRAARDLGLVECVPARFVHARRTRHPEIGRQRDIVARFVGNVAGRLRLESLRELALAIRVDIRREQLDERAVLILLERAGKGVLHEFEVIFARRRVVDDQLVAVAQPHILGGGVCREGVLFVSEEVDGRGLAALREAVVAVLFDQHGLADDGVEVLFRDAVVRRAVGVVREQLPRLFLGAVEFAARQHADRDLDRGLFAEQDGYAAGLRVVGHRELGQILKPREVLDEVVDKVCHKILGEPDADGVVGDEQMTEDHVDVAPDVRGQHAEVAAAAVVDGAGDRVPDHILGIGGTETFRAFARFRGREQREDIQPFELDLVKEVAAAAARVNETRILGKAAAVDVDARHGILIERHPQRQHARVGRLAVEVGVVEELYADLRVREHRLDERHGVGGLGAAHRSERILHALALDIRGQSQLAADVREELRLAERRRLQQELEVVRRLAFHREQLGHLLGPVDDLAELETEVERQRQLDVLHRQHGRQVAYLQPAAA